MTIREYLQLVRHAKQLTNAIQVIILIQLETVCIHWICSPNHHVFWSDPPAQHHFSYSYRMWKSLLREIIQLRNLSYMHHDEFQVDLLPTSHTHNGSWKKRINLIVLFNLRLSAYELQFQLHNSPIDMHDRSSASSSLYHKFIYFPSKNIYHASRI